MAMGERAGVIGGFVAWRDDDRFTEALYLSSREPDGLRRQASTPLGRAMAAHASPIEEATVLELADPSLTSPRTIAPGSREAP